MRSMSQTCARPGAYRQQACDAAHRVVAAVGVRDAAPLGGF